MTLSTSGSLPGLLDEHPRDLVDLALDVVGDGDEAAQCFGAADLITRAGYSMPTSVASRC
jgi:hypothetical protein